MRQIVTTTIVFVFIVASALAACPPGSVQGLNKQQCYVLGNTSASWLQAERQCAALKGHLASVTSIFTNRFLYTLEIKSGTSGDHWLGGYYNMDFNDKFPRTVWQWSDALRFVFSDWAKGKSGSYPGFSDI
ncbi:type-2 ice-structuring protein-like protein [Aphelenchoides avenae]|nr:type-2 ice-structuring protein-like protein [Aphelenchus avenae]